MKNVLEFEGNSNSTTIDVLEEAIRGRAREVIEALYEDEVHRLQEKLRQWKPLFLVHILQESHQTSFRAFCRKFLEKRQKV